MTYTLRIQMCAIIDSEQKKEVRGFQNSDQRVVKRSPFEELSFSKNTDFSGTSIWLPQELYICDTLHAHSSGCFSHSCAARGGCLAWSFLSFRVILQRRLLMVRRIWILALTTALDSGPYTNSPGPACQPETKCVRITNTGASLELETIYPAKYFARTNHAVWYYTVLRMVLRPVLRTNWYAVLAFLNAISPE